ncbi:MAG: exodeoxyribonuclease VII small subunit [Candidatus Paralactobacillus gallistercoris]|uniref:Exodeoxyribonuclease 7 small subunit n=1 Tax=Candidatus Paralactobacillus gallistercoris TaxID=2838724 RepID=A0A948TJB8_9LACO|nr:exodeoxyribonuclease VII small subunit [Candidatus Paralactobacillus gallistercoris]
MADDFETKLQQLNEIVTNLESGQVPLEKALAEFKTGMQLSKQLESTLNNAEQAVTQIMDDNDHMHPFNNEEDDK